MSSLFYLTRGSFLTFVKNLDDKKADVQPEQFNNTIHWHIGHVLVTAEGLLFGYPMQSVNFSEAYNGLFKSGTKPADWTTEVPDISALTKHLDEQQTRVNALSDEFFTQDIPFTLPFGNFKTYGDIFDMLILHENEHLGKIKAMKQVVAASL